MWNIKSKGHDTLTDQNDTIASLAWSPNGKYLASASISHVLYIWEVSSKQVFIGPLRGTHIAWVVPDSHAQSDASPTSKRLYLVLSEAEQVFIFLVHELERDEHKRMELISTYSAPASVTSIICRGDTICAGCKDGQVCVHCLSVSMPIRLSHVSRSVSMLTSTPPFCLIIHAADLPHCTGAHTSLVPNKCFLFVLACRFFSFMRPSLRWSDASSYTVQPHDRMICRHVA